MLGARAVALLSSIASAGRNSLTSPLCVSLFSKMASAADGKEVCTIIALLRTTERERDQTSPIGNPVPALQEKNSFARRDLLLQIQATAQKSWDESKLFEVDAPAGQYLGGFLSELHSPTVPTALCTGESSSRMQLSPAHVVSCVRICLTAGSEGSTWLEVTPALTQTLESEPEHVWQSHTCSLVPCMQRALGPQMRSSLVIFRTPT